MSEVDVMFPQERLSCGVSSDIQEQTVDLNVDRTEEPSGDEVLSENDKQLEKVIFVSKRHSDNMSEADVDHNTQEVRKKKHRRGKKRKWRPYNKLSWEERRELEERDARRANRVRAEMFAHGQPLAPYNTTQFLMEDHNLREPDYERIPNGHRHRENSNSMGSSDEFYSSPEDEEDFLQKQFTEAYENVHVERLNSMPKCELVQELMQMEDRYEELEKRLEDARAKTQTAETVENEVQTPDLSLEEQMEKIRVFREEIKKLKDENERLRKENEELRTLIPESTR